MLRAPTFVLNLRMLPANWCLELGTQSTPRRKMARLAHTSKAGLRTVVRLQDTLSHVNTHRHREERTKVVVFTEIAEILVV
jgi:hypothetical protein